MRFEIKKIRGCDSSMGSTAAWLPLAIIVVAASLSQGYGARSLLAALSPAEILGVAKGGPNYLRWKLQLPDGSDEVMPSELASTTYQHAGNYYASGQDVILVTPAKGVPTSGSDFPRTELREMASNGTAKASWSTTDVKPHVMTFTGAVVQLPPLSTGDSRVTIAQIKNDDSQPMELQVYDDGKGAKIRYRINSTPYVLVNNYTLNGTYTVTITAGGGYMRVNIDYNGFLYSSGEISNKKSTCYFKVGNYIQTNKAGQSIVKLRSISFL